VDVTQPLEQVGRAVSGAVYVESTTSRGSAEIFIDFPWGWDMQRALLAVQGAFAQALPDLPQGTGFDVLQMSPTAIMPFVSYALISDTVSPSDLRNLAKYQIAPLLTGVLGGETPEVQVYVSPQKLQAYGLTMKDVASAISDTNTLHTMGRLEDNDLLYLMIANNSFKSVDSVKDVALHTGKGGVVRLGDIADVKMGSVPQWLL